VAADAHTAAGVIDGLDKNRVVFAPDQYAAHDARYFADVRRLVNLERQKKNVNARTLSVFGKRWFVNSARNLPMLARCNGVARFAGAASGLPCCVLGAGPSLDSLLPRLAALKERCVLIAVDTALRTCLRWGVEPDFVVLTDPQYWNAAHLAGLSAPDSILVTEIAAYPQVMRFPCRQVVLFDSLYPLGQYFARALDCPKGSLSAGGSVASSAWDLARVLGAGEIYLAGLDLGFPGRRTHAAGSLFEEAAHASSRRLRPAETPNAAALFAARAVPATDYAGNALASDERLTFYAWWFESEFAKDRVRVFSLTPESRALKGAESASVDALLQKSAAQKTGLKIPPPAPCPGAEARIRAESENLCRKLRRVQADAKTGAAVCESALKQSRPSYAAAFKTLGAIDGRIRSSNAGAALSLVFPSAEKLDAEYAALAPEKDPGRANLRRSLLLYARIEAACAECLGVLRRYAGGGATSSG
jgi:hypothetical protein